MKYFLSILTIAGLFFSCQREEVPNSFASDTDISVLPNSNTEINASNDAVLGWVALTGQI